MASRQREIQVVATAAFIVMDEILQKKKRKTLVDYKIVPKTKCQHIIKCLTISRTI
ncbi:hypothetical protein AVEN_63670-1, partial [Araneus ventricosus]